MSQGVCIIYCMCYITFVAIFPLNLVYLGVKVLHNLMLEHLHILIAFI